jgi:hypothetical protein
MRANRPGQEQKTRKRGASDVSNAEIEKRSLRLGVTTRFDISVDGRSVGSIEWRETIEVPVDPGRHTLRIRAGRYSSRDQFFEIADGEMINYRLHGAMLWPLHVASVVKPDLAISLKRE